jgi:hypothetical protein
MAPNKMAVQIGHITEKNKQAAKAHTKFLIPGHSSDASQIKQTIKIKKISPTPILYTSTIHFTVGLV